MSAITLEEEMYIITGILSVVCVIIVMWLLVLTYFIDKLKQKQQTYQPKITTENYPYSLATIQPDEELCRRGYSMLHEGQIIVPRLKSNGDGLYGAKYPTSQYSNQIEPKNTPIVAAKLNEVNLNKHNRDFIPINDRITGNLNNFSNNDTPADRGNYQENNNSNQNIRNLEPIESVVPQQPRLSQFNNNIMLAAQNNTTEEHNSNTSYYNNRALIHY